MKNNLKEIIVAVFLVIIAILLLNPFHFWMPDMMVMIMLGLLLALFATLATFIIREGKFDERDNIHRMLAGRNAFLAGSAILIIGIIIEANSHSVDFWLVLALIVMILVKLFTRFWSDKNL